MMQPPDSYDLWKAHERDQQRRLDRLPVCYYCDEPIQDEHFYQIHGENICPECLENFKKSTDDFSE